MDGRESSTIVDRTSVMRAGFQADRSMDIATLKLPRNTPSATAARLQGIPALLARYPRNKQLALRQLVFERIDIVKRLETVHARLAASPARGGSGSPGGRAASPMRSGSPTRRGRGMQGSGPTDGLGRKPEVLISLEDQLAENTTQLRRLAGSHWGELDAALDDPEVRAAMESSVAQEEDFDEEAAARLWRRKLRNAQSRSQRTQSLYTAHDAPDHTGRRWLSNALNSADDTSMLSYYELQQRRYGRGRRGSTAIAGAWKQVLAEATTSMPAIREEPSVDRSAAAPLAGAGDSRDTMDLSVLLQEASALVAQGKPGAAAVHSPARPTPAAYSASPQQGLRASPAAAPRSASPTSRPQQPAPSGSPMAATSSGRSRGNTLQRQASATATQDSLSNVMKPTRGTASARAAARGAPAAPAPAAAAPGDVAEQPIPEEVVAAQAYFTELNAMLSLREQRALRECILDSADCLHCQDALQAAGQDLVGPSAPEIAVAISDVRAAAGARMADIIGWPHTRQVTQHLQQASVREAMGYVPPPTQLESGEDSREWRRALARIQRAHAGLVTQPTLGELAVTSEDRNVPGKSRLESTDNVSYYQRQQSKYGRAQRGSHGVADAWQQIWAEQSAEPQAAGPDQRAPGSHGSPQRPAATSSPPAGQPPQQQQQQQPPPQKHSSLAWPAPSAASPPPMRAPATAPAASAASPNTASMGNKPASPAPPTTGAEQSTKSSPVGEPASTGDADLDAEMQRTLAHARELLE